MHQTSRPQSELSDTNFQTEHSSLTYEINFNRSLLTLSFFDLFDLAIFWALLSCHHKRVYNSTSIFLLHQSLFFGILMVPVPITKVVRFLLRHSPLLNCHWLGAVGFWIAASRRKCTEPDCIGLLRATVLSIAAN